MQPKSITINTTALSKAIDTVIRCVNTDKNAKVATQGVYIVATPPSDRTPGSIRFTAMDSYRLATCEIEYDGTDSFEAIAHAKNLKPLIASLRKTGSEILKIFRWQGMLEFWAVGGLGGYLGNAAIIEGDFPGYQHLIPGQFKRTVTCDRAALVNGIQKPLKQLRHGSKARQNVMTGLNVRSAESSLIISTPDVEMCDFREISTIPVEIDGEGVAIAFNSELLLGVLKSMTSQKVRLQMNNRFSPMTIAPVSEDKTLLVISPIQIRAEDMTYLEHAGVRDAVFGVKGIKSYGEGGMKVSDLLSPILKDALVEAGMYQEESMCSVVFVQTSPSYRMEIFWDEEKQLAAIAVAEEALYWTKASSTKDAIERYLQVDGKAIAPQSS